MASAYLAEHGKNFQQPPAEGRQITGDHRDTHDNQQYTGNDMKRWPVAAQATGVAHKVIGEQGGDDEGHAEPRGIDCQQSCSITDQSRGRTQGQYCP
jgi:hypothetical protein